MSKNNRIMPRALVLAYISVFASLNIIADSIPLTPILGIQGASFRLGWILSPLTGILLGAKMGGASCLIAGLIELFYQPLTFGPFTPFRSVISALIAGMLVSNNWHIPVASILFMIIIWVISPVGKEAYQILLFHAAGLVAILFFRKKIGAFIRSEDRKRISIALFIAAYSGNISRHLFGNIISAVFLNIPSLYFIISIPFTLIEQTVFAIGATIIGIAFIRFRLQLNINDE